MKKLDKQHLCKLANEMPIIGIMEQKSLIGGGSGTSTDPYTRTEMEFLMNNSRYAI